MAKPNPFAKKIAPKGKAAATKMSGVKANKMTGGDCCAPGKKK